MKFCESELVSSSLLTMNLHKLILFLFFEKYINNLFSCKNTLPYELLHHWLDVTEHHTALLFHMLLLEITPRCYFIGSYSKAHCVAISYEITQNHTALLFDMKLLKTTPRCYFNESACTFQNTVSQLHCLMEGCKTINTVFIVLSQ